MFIMFYIKNIFMMYFGRVIEYKMESANGSMCPSAFIIERKVSTFLFNFILETNR